MAVLQEARTILLLLVVWYLQINQQETIKVD